MEFRPQHAARSVVSRVVAVLPLVLLPITGCTDQDLSEPATAEAAGEPVTLRNGRWREKRLTAVEVSPSPVMLRPSAKQMFTASGILADSSTIPLQVRWSASAGKIDASGLYTAPAEPGGYRLIGRTESGRADTVPITVESPSGLAVTRVILTPEAVTVTPGGTQAFAASAQFEDGSTGPTTVTYAASAGTVSSVGLFTAPQQTGSVRLIATAPNGKADTSAVTVADSTTPPSSSQTPYTQAVPVPGTIQAEHFDKGGQNVAYSDAETTNYGGRLRTAEGVDIKTSSDNGGGYAVGWVSKGEWLEYSIVAANAGRYTIETRVATPGTGKTFHLEIDGKDVSGPLAVPVTGAWNTTWASVRKSDVELTAGPHILRFVADASDFDVNYFAVTAAGGSPPPSPEPPPPPPTQPPQGGPAQPDRQWAGISANTGFYTDAGYVGQVNSHASTLGKGLVRMGVDHIGGNTAGAAFNWGGRDATVAAHLAAGMTIHSVASPTAHVAKGTSMAQWQANWRYFIGSVMAHYKGKIGYYIIDNEPDLFSGQTPQTMVEFTRIAFEESRRVAPDGSIKIESPPTSAAGVSYLQQMINLGITRYCDFVGVHAYGGGINDEHGGGIRKPWEWMLASGHPVRPVANSENGVSTEWAKAGVNALEWQARWYRQNWIQHKRYAYDHVLLYSIRSQSPPFNFANWTGSTIVPVQPTYDAIRKAYTTLPFGNGGFEEANDRELEWAVYYNVDQATPVEWSRANFIRGDASGARTGTGYLRFDTGESSGQNIVRRVVEQLVPGRSYRVSAWVKITGGGTARLKAQGFNHLNGLQESVQTTSTRDSWQQLSVTFTPSKTWVVIGLEGTGTGAGGHVMHWDDVTLSQ